MTHIWQIFCQYYYLEITRKLPGPDFTKNYLPGLDPDPVILDSFTHYKCYLIFFLTNALF